MSGARRDPPVPSKKLKLRRPDVCVMCGASLPRGVEAWWDRDRRVVTCTRCHNSRAPSVPPPNAAPARGTPGASLDREYQRRKTIREARIRNRHPRIGGLLLALGDEPQHQRAFDQGGRSEQHVAHYLEKRTARSPTMLLHNRRMPGGRGDIDHIAICPTGIYVIDAKAVKGKVKIATPLFGKAKLLINGRDHTSFLDGLDRQIAAVRTILHSTGHRDIPIHGAICFTKANLPFLMTQKMRGYLLTYTRALARRLNRPGKLDEPSLRELTQLLAARLSPA